VCDVARAMLVASDMRTVGAIADALRALQAEGLVEVRRVKGPLGACAAEGRGPARPPAAVEGQRVQGALPFK